MSLLTRYLQLNDSCDSQIFTFVVTKAVTRDFHRDVISKNFTYAWHKWAITFTREDKALGVLLVWRSPSEGVRVEVDLSITLLNRENFAENRNFTITKAQFESGKESIGNKNVIKIAELLTHRPRFVDANGEFLLEVRLSSASSFYQCDLFMRSDGNTESHDYEAMEVDSKEFLYGVFRWTLCIRPQPLFLLPLSSHSSWSEPLRKALKHQAVNNSGGSGVQTIDQQKEFDHLGIGVTLKRISNNSTDDLYARLNYKITVVKGEDNLKWSEICDEVLGPGASSTSWSPRSRLHEIYSRPDASKKVVRIRVDLLSAHPITEVTLSPCGAAGSNGAGFRSDNETNENKGFAHVVNGAKKTVAREGSGGPVLTTDADNVNWALDLDLHSSFIRVKLILQDISRIPRNHLRFVQWRSFLVRRSRRWRGHRDDRDQLESVEFQPGTIYKFYYSQDDSDQGVIMETNLPTKDVKDGMSEYVEDGLFVRVRIQWEQSFQLFQSTYSQYDEVVKIHNQQMRDEILNLNKRLEHSISSDGKGSISDKRLEVTSIENSCGVITVCRSPSPTPNYIGGDTDSPRVPSPISPRVKRILTKSNSQATPGVPGKHTLRIIPPLQHQRSLQSSLAPPSLSGSTHSMSPSMERVNGRAVSLNRLTGSHQSLRKTDSNSSVGSMSAAQQMGETSASGPGTPMTGHWSPTIPLIKLIAPLRQSLSVSADNLPRPRTMAAGMRKPWPPGSPKSSPVSKCQSID